ncbi:hypothetical protein ON010_g7045 [Phytophthora cinnamomi]|nr:hypothetical protein ON010_g7045 [Phytophthora cinnamomi]
MDPHHEYKALGDGAATQLTSYKLLQTATALIATALIVLLIGSPSALRLTRALQTNTKWCEDVAPTSSLFQSGVLVLQVCAGFNVALVTAAWLLVALILNYYDSASPRPAWHPSGAAWCIPLAVISSE